MTIKIKEAKKKKQAKEKLKDDAEGRLDASHRFVPFRGCRLTSQSDPDLKSDEEGDELI